MIDITSEETLKEIDRAVLKMKNGNVQGIDIKQLFEKEKVA